MFLHVVLILCLDRKYKPPLLGGFYTILIILDFVLVRMDTFFGVV